MKIHNTIYSIHTKTNSSGLLHIETVITSGLYNFILLGIPRNYSSDLKNKIYTSLRADGLLNLKSDNRKITANIVADRDGIAPTYAELAVAISCALCMSQKQITHSILIIGGLSITGTVIPSNRLLQTIHTALTHNISYIACTEDDILQIEPEYIEHARQKNIQFIVGKTVKEILHNIQHLIIYKVADNTETKKLEHVDPHTYKETLQTLRDNYLEWSILVAMCGQHSIMIQTNNIHTTATTIDDMSKSLPRHTLERRLQFAYESRLDDIYFQQITRKGFYIKNDTHRYDDAHTQKIASFIYNENISSKVPQIHSTNYNISTCLHCSCGNRGAIQSKCLCLQRNILRYNNMLNSLHKDIYTLWISHYQHQVQNTPQYDHEILQKIVEYVHTVKKHTSPVISEQTKHTLDKLKSTMGKKCFEKIIQVSQTLQILSDIERFGALDIDQIKRPTLISSKNLLLAFSYIPKKDS